MEFMEVKTGARIPYEPEPYEPEPCDPHPFQAIYELAAERRAADRLDMSIRIPHPGADYRVQVVAPICSVAVVQAEGLVQKYSMNPDSAFVRIWDVAARCGVGSEGLHAAQAAVNGRFRDLASSKEARQFVAEWNHRAKLMCMAAAAAEKALEGVPPGQGAERGQTLDGLAAAFAAWVDQDPRARRLFVATRIAFELSFAGGGVAITLLGEVSALSESAYAKSSVRELPAALLESARARLRAA